MHVCVLCDEPIGEYDAWNPLNSYQYAHYECSLREVVGGIGHLLAHPFWCILERDTDAGLTYRQSAQMVKALVDLLGIEEVIRRGTCGRAAVEEAEEVEASLFSDDEAFERELGDLRWRTDPEPGSA